MKPDDLTADPATLAALMRLIQGLDALPPEATSPQPWLH